MKSGRRKAARVDSNQTIVVKELRKSGFSVRVMSRIGKGFPDLIVGFSSYNFLVEVKSENGKLTKDQEKFIENWNGKVFVIYSFNDFLDQLLDYLELLKKSRLVAKKIIDKTLKTV